MFPSTWKLSCLRLQYLKITQIFTSSPLVRAKNDLVTLLYRILNLCGFFSNKKKLCFFFPIRNHRIMGASVQLEIEWLIIVCLRNLILVNSDLNQRNWTWQNILYQYAVKADMRNRKSGKLQIEHCEPFRPLFRWKSYILYLLVNDLTNFFYYEVITAVPSQRMPLC